MGERSPCGVRRILQILYMVCEEWAARRTRACVWRVRECGGVELERCIHICYICGLISHTQISYNT